jgi:hypothetical protein
VLTSTGPRDALQQLSHALDGPFRKTARRDGLTWLATLPGRYLIALDTVARVDLGYDGPPIPVRPDPEESTGLGAVLASLYRDGRVRERALPHLPADLAARFLALRTADHVPQIRERARSLLFALPPDPAALEVLLLARRHPLHTSPIYDYAARLTVDQLAAVRAVTTDRVQRRWAFQHSLSTGALTLEELKAAAVDADQWVRVRCADALAQRADAGLAPSLLTSRYAATRVAALLRLPDELLSDAQLEDALFDRSARVRELAQWRDRRRGGDPAKTYRDLAAADEPVVASRSTGLVCGLFETGKASELPVMVRYLTHERPRVRLVAVKAVAAWTDGADRARLLGPMLLDPSTKVAGAAARALGTLPRVLTDEFTEAAWASDQPWSRRVAVQAEYARGPWYVLEAILRLIGDPDPGLAHEGRSMLPIWHRSAPNGWPSPDGEQKARLRGRMVEVGMDDPTIRRLSFYAGL